MEPLAQREGERIWMEAELLAIERAIDDQRRNSMPEAADAQDGVIRLLTGQLEERFARLQEVNAKLAELRRAGP
jgi:hypothetical protein